MTETTLLDPTKTYAHWTTGVYLDPLETTKTWNITELLELMKVDGQDTLPAISVSSITIRAGEAGSVIEVKDAAQCTFSAEDTEKPEILTLSTTVSGRIKKTNTIAYGGSALKQALEEGAVYEVEVPLSATFNVDSRELTMQPAPVKYLFAGWEELPQGKGYPSDADRNQLVAEANAELDQAVFLSFMPSFARQG